MKQIKKVFFALIALFLAVVGLSACGRNTTTTNNPITPTTQNGGDKTTTQNGGDKTTTQNGGNKTTTKDPNQNVTTLENKYNITFKDEDGKVLRTLEVNEGAMPSFGANPTKESDNTYNYTFKGWSPALEVVSKDAIYTATYEASYIDYVVKFVNDDDTVISSVSYHYGDTIVVPQNPTKQSTEEFVYTFKSWDKEVSETVSANATYKATYNEALRKYNVSFVTNGDSVILDLEVEYGKKALAPENPVLLGFVFGGWFIDEELTKAYDFNDEVTKDITLYAKWDSPFYLQLTVDGNNKFYTVVGLKDYDVSELVFPNEYNGIPVTDIHIIGTAPLKNLRKVVIPENIKIIFASDTFSSAYNLKEIYNLSQLSISKGSSNNAYIAMYALTIHDSEDEESCIKEDANGFLFYVDEDDKAYLFGSTKDDKDLILPDSFNGKKYSIASYAFSNTNITSVTISDGVEEIGTNAFSYCYSLNKIVIGKNVKTVGYNLFYGSYVKDIYNLSTLNIIPSSSVGSLYVMHNKLEESGFTNIEGFLFKKEEDVNLLCGYIGEEVDLVLPKNVNGETYVIGNHAFERNTNIKSVKSTEGVTSIGEGAFANCTNLQTIEFLGELTNIDSNSFYGCYNLISVKINLSEDATVDSYAFQTCYKGTEVYNLGNNSNLVVPNTLVKHTDASEESKLINEDGYLFFKDGELLKLIAYVGSEKDLVLPEKDEEYIIWSYAFAYSDIRSIVIPDCVTSTGECIFEGCTNLRKVVFPLTLTNVRYRILAGLTQLEELTIGKLEAEAITIGQLFGSQSQFGTVPIWQTIYSSARSFYVPASLKKVTVLGGTSINASAFKDMWMLEEVVIPDSITTIGNYAFYGCVNIKSFKMPEALTNIGNYAFKGVSFDSLVFEEGLKEIGQYTFENCGATLVSLPKSLTKIGTNAFLGNKIEKVYYNGSISDYLGVTISASTSNRYANPVAYDFAKFYLLDTEGDVVFNEHRYNLLTDLVIPEGVTEIKGGLFLGFNQLNSVTIPNGVTVINECSFSYCRNINTITLPSSLKSINYDAFAGCSKLVEVINKSNLSLTKGNTRNGSVALYALSILGANDTSNIKEENGLVFLEGENQAYFIGYRGSEKNVVLPQKFNDKEYEIISYAFASNEVIETVTINAEIKTIPAYAFNNAKNLKKVVLSEGLEEIKDYAFDGCTSLEEINLPSTLKKIGYRAFYSTESLKKLNIPKSTNEIDNFLGEFSGIEEVYYEGEISDWLKIKFESKYNNPMYFASSFYILDSEGDVSFNNKKFKLLTEIEIDSEVTSIGNYQFYGFKDVESITLPDGLLSIGSYALYNMSSLESLIIPDSVNYIDSAAIQELNSLKSLTIGKGVTTANSGLLTGLYNLEELTLPFIGDRLYDSTCPFIYIFGSEAVLNIDSLVKVESRYTYGSSILRYVPNTLKKVTITNQTNLQNGAFYGVPMVETVILSERLEKINSNVLYNSGVKNLVLNNKITNTYTDTFSGAKALMNVYYNGSIDDWLDIKFDGTYSNPMIYAYNFYLLDQDGTYEFEGKKYSKPYSIEIPYSSKIGNYKFFGFEQLVSVTIPSGTNGMGGSAFGSCHKLVEVINKSDYNIILGSINNGGAAENALILVDKADADNYETKIVKDGDYLYYVDGDIVYLLSYLGSEKELVLPEKYNEKAYEIYKYAFAGSSVEKITVSAYTTRILDGAFKRSSLKEIILPEGLLEIGKEAFSFAPISAIEIPETLTIVGERAFYGCQNLKELVLPVSVQSIGESIIGRTDSLESLTIPFIGDTRENTSKYPIGYIFSSESGTVVEQYFNNGTSSLYLTMPESLKKVTVLDGKIPYGAFYLFEYLEEIVLGDGVTEIGAKAFYRCLRLTKLSMGKNVAKIGANAFDNCDALELTEYEGNLYLGNSENPYQVLFKVGSDVLKIKLHDDTKYIIKEATLENKGIVSITLNAKLEGIADDTFMYCSRLVEVYNLSELELVKGSDAYGCVAKYAIDLYTSLESESHIIESGDYLIFDDGEDVLLIGYNGNEPILSLPELEGKEYSVSPNVFKNHKEITKVIIPSNVSEISPDAFTGCNNITFVSLKAELLQIVKTMTSVKEVVITGGEAIQPNALYNQQAIETITIPASLRTIGGYAFYKATLINNIYYNGTIADWLNILFESEYSNPIVANASNAKLYIKDENGTIEHEGNKYSLLTNLIIPEGVEKIGQYQFEYYKFIESLSLPSTLKEVEASAFKGSGIKEVILPSSLNKVGYNAFGSLSLDKLVINSEYLEGAESLSLAKDISATIEVLKNMNWPKNSNAISNVKIIRVLGGGKFTTTDGNLSNIKYCSELSKLYLNEEVSLFDKRVLRDKYVYTESKNGLYIGSEDNEYLYFVGMKDTTATSIVFEQGVVGIAQQAFQNSKLTAVTIPETIRYISDYAFSSSKSLEIVNVNSTSLDYLGNYAFDSCSNIQYREVGNVKYLGNETNPYLILCDFSSTDLNQTSFTVKKETQAILNHAFDSCTFTSIIFEEGSSLKIVGNYAFYRCSELVSIELPEGLKYIGNNAFQNCSKLQKVVIPTTVVSIGNNAFYNCSVINSITLPITSDVLYRGYESYIYPIGKIFGGSGTSVSQNSFVNGNASTTRYNIPSTLKTVSITGKLISYGAFSKMTSIRTVFIGKDVETIYTYAFSGCSNIQKVYYFGTEEDKENINYINTNSNQPLINATWYYYNENALNETNPGNYFYFNESGEVVERVVEAS
ncbi:MAG: leucine-rich repeat protein [Gammaproteobacteria bacterium]|nr:leucine-rich repeat protein [Gammaproteobacteria bacterium]